MDGQEITRLFCEHSPRAVEELRAKYEKLFMRVALNILNDRSDAEECINSAMLILWDTVPEKKPDELMSYSVRVVRNCALKMYRDSRARKRNSRYDAALDEIEQTVCAIETTETAADAEFLTKYIEEFLDGQTKENRAVFIRRYWFGDSCAEIASALGLSVKNVTVKLSRTRSQLKKFLSERDVIV